VWFVARPASLRSEPASSAAEIAEAPHANTDESESTRIEAPVLGAESPPSALHEISESGSRETPSTLAQSGLVGRADGDDGGGRTLGAVAARPRAARRRSFPEQPEGRRVAQGIRAFDHLQPASSTCTAASSLFVDPPQSVSVEIRAAGSDEPVFESASSTCRPDSAAPIPSSIRSICVRVLLWSDIQAVDAAGQQPVERAYAVLDDGRRSKALRCVSERSPRPARDRASSGLPARGTDARPPARARVAVAAR
jgi:hypothetical protein